MNRKLSLPSTPALEANETISAAVVDAVAEAEDESPLDLEPLATVIDPDALNRLVASMSRRPSEPTGAVEFAYSNYEITVTEDGTVSATPLEAQE